MRLRIILSNLGHLASPQSPMNLATRAEELNFDGVFISDHLTLPTVPRSRYAYGSDGSFPADGIPA